MKIPRFHLFEFEDKSWLPVFLRNYMTDYLRFIMDNQNPYAQTTPLLLSLAEETGNTRVIDLCSGGAGPIPAISKQVQKDGRELDFVLTDKFPNLPAFEAAAESNGHISFYPNPVDVLAVPQSLKGIRTLFTAFHHFEPSVAKAILRDATESKAPIAIFEVTNRSLLYLLAFTLFCPPMVLLTTPFFKPFSWKRLFWTYIIPAVPFLCWWDGIISHLRSYTPEEMLALAEEASSEYNWRSGKLYHHLGLPPVTYLIGTPKETLSDF